MGGDEQREDPYECRRKALREFHNAICDEFSKVAIPCLKVATRFLLWISGKIEGFNNRNAARRKRRGI